jgi:ribonucleoside-diphosphate reductase alpha chain
LQEHVDVLISAAERVDSAVSKTCNVPPNTPWEDFKNVYVQAWERGAKGCTTFNVGGKRMGILKAGSQS